jgi:Phytanoyl-CoA dioxygenase (PhyH)
MGVANDLSGWIDADGFALVEGVFEEKTVERLREFVEAEATTSTGKGGVRNLLELPQMRVLAECAVLRDLIVPVIGTDAKVVRGILFDKTSDANWKVPLHQDVTIAVSQRVESDGYGPWSTKAGVLHVQPPAAVLEKMISVRIHLDDCPEENGALRVIAGSHRSGKLPASLPEEYFMSHPFVVCEVKSGGVLLMRPLLLHASSAATIPAHRRVIHFDYAATELPAGMGWAAD